MKRWTFLFVAFFLMAAPELSGQNLVEDKFAAWSRLLSPEKLYLHTDREVYNIGDTIWFRGYLQNVSALAANAPCNYLYVELIAGKYEKNLKNEREERVRMRQRVKVKRDGNGTFTGYLPLTEDLNTGIATLRAYSYWMLNFSPEYLYAKNIELRNPMKDHFVADLMAVEYADQLTYDELGVRNPFRKELLRRGKSETKVDLQFLPESGRYLPGRRSVIGVKAVNGEGLGIKVKGDVFADGAKVATFQTNELGMGKFTLTVPAVTKKLRAVAETAVEQFQFEASVPLPEAKGVVIGVLPSDTGISIAVADAGLTLSAETFLVVYNDSQIVLKSPYAECHAGKRVGYGELSPGINHVAVVDEAGRVYADRPFFVFPDGAVQGRVIFDKPKYGKREKAMATVRLTDGSGRPVNGNFSLAVTDDTYAPNSGKGHNIESWLLLGSELKGLVENPRHYFDPSVSLSQRRADVDVLLLTQGWTYYELEKILTQKTRRPRFGKEYTQSLSGYVNAVFGKAKKSTLCFVAPSINFSMIADLDSTAYFALNNLDFPDNTQFLVGAQRDGKLFKSWYTPILNPEYFAAECTYPNYLKAAGYSDDYGDYARQSYYSNDGTLAYTLAPARIMAPRANLSPYPNDTFKPHQVREEKDLMPFADDPVVAYIANTCPGVHYEGNALVGPPSRMGSRMNMNKTFVPINIYLNGFQVSQQDIEGLMVSDIDCLVYIDGMDATKYDTAFTSLDYAVRRSPPVVLISSRFTVKLASNVTADRPLGWQKPAKFYAPKYESAASKKRFEPMRATLHWEPDLSVENGEARFEFYTSDHQVPYRIILEGLTGDLKPVFVETTL